MNRKGLALRWVAIIMAILALALIVTKKVQEADKEPERKTKIITITIDLETGEVVTKSSNPDIEVEILLQFLTPDSGNEEAPAIKDVEATDNILTEEQKKKLRETAKAPCS